MEGGEEGGSGLGNERFDNNNLFFFHVRSGMFQYRGVLTTL